MKYKVETCVCLSFSKASIEQHFEELVQFQEILLHQNRTLFDHEVAEIEETSVGDCVLEQGSVVMMAKASNK